MICFVGRTPASRVKPPVKVGHMAVVETRDHSMSCIAPSYFRNNNIFTLKGGGKALDELAIYPVCFRYEFFTDR